MDWMTSLEKRFGSWAIPNPTLFLLTLQAIGVALIVGQYNTREDLLLVGGLVQVGQWWRLFSFMLLPETLSPIWLVFSFYFLWMMGGALEKEWGVFKYNLFILSGYLFTVAAAFVNPSAQITNTYFLGCVLLAFATLFPRFEIRLFFLIPVQVRWIGWVTAVAYVLAVFGNNPHSKTTAAAALLNYLLFFGKDIFRSVKAGGRKQAYVAARRKSEGQPIHRCSKCGVTDKSDESVHFRYCSTCGQCFCEEHISDHGH